MDVCAARTESVVSHLFLQCLDSCVTNEFCVARYSHARPSKFCFLEE